MVKQNEDYYSILGISKEASDAEIKQAFKKQAFIYHPDKSNDPNSHRMFAKISHAFDVLSSPEKRRQYDLYGTDGMKRSATFNGSSNKTHFGGINGEWGSYPNIIYKDPPVFHDLYVSLEEVMKGTKKKIKVTRKVTKKDNVTKIEEKILTIDVKPGWKEGTKIIFEKEGDKKVGVIPADVIFILRDKPHPVFKRNGNDVVYIAKIPLKLALLGGKLMIPTLDGDKKLLKWNEVVTPKSEKRLKGMGLPIANLSELRGDLVVRFDIIFPKSLSDAEKQMLEYGLPPFPQMN